MGRARTTLEPRSKVNYRTIAHEGVLAQSKIDSTSRLGSGLDVGSLGSIFFTIGNSMNSRVPERLVQRLLLGMYIYLRPTRTLPSLCVSQPGLTSCLC